LKEVWRSGSEARLRACNLIFIDTKRLILSDVRIGHLVPYAVRLGNAWNPRDRKRDLLKVNLHTILFDERATIKQKTLVADEIKCTREYQEFILKLNRILDGIP